MRVFLILTVIGVVALLGCSNRNPLDSDPAPPQQNTVTVTVYSGSALAPSVGVYLKAPDGSTTSGLSDTQGQVQFARSGTGVYYVGLSGQAAQTPVEYEVRIQPGQALYAISLQMAGAAFAISAPTGQGNGFGWQSESKNWTITYFNSSDMAADLTLDLNPAYPTPSGWTAAVTPTYLRKGEAATLNVVIPQGSQVGNTTLRVRGRKSDGTTLLYADIVMPQEWSFRVRRIYRFEQGSYYCANYDTNFTALTITAETIGVPQGALVEFVPGAISADGCNICGGVFSNTAYWSSISLLFNPGVINGLILTNPGSQLARWYRTAGAGGCGGYNQPWTIAYSFKLGSTTKVVTDNVTVLLNGPWPQTFTFFN